MRRFELCYLTKEAELDLAFFMHPETGVWRLGNEHLTLAQGDVVKESPKRAVCSFEQYRIGVATGVMRTPARRLAEYGGFSGLMGGEPAPELDDLIMPGYERPVVHLFIEVPGEGACGFARISFPGTGNVHFAMATSREGPEKGGDLDPMVDLDSFFLSMEFLFGLPPEE